MIAVSAVIPCYNRQDTIGDAIASVRAQTVQPYELLVVDDGSDDDSVRVAERAGAHVIRMSRNTGNAAARNVGLRAAAGEAIAWLDSDDRWEPDHLATVVPLLGAHPAAAVASAGIGFAGARSGIWYGDVPAGPPAMVARQAFRATVIPMITSVVRRDALLQIGGFDESARYAVDFDLWLRLALRYPFVAARAVTATYNCHANQISAQPERQWYATYIFRRRAMDELLRQGDTSLAADLAQVYLDRWAGDLQEAWDNERIEWLARLLELAPTIPDVPWRLRLKWQFRSRIPSGVRRMIRAAREDGVSGLLRSAAA